MKFLQKYVLLISMPALFMISCKKFVEIPPPTNQLVTVDVFNTNASASSAVTGIYTQMFNNNDSYYIALANGLLSDELTNYSTAAPQIQYYINSMIAINSPGQWANAYSYIYQANAVIEGLLNNSAITPAIASQLTGEAYFIRAFWHFYLTSCYGSVPLVMTTNPASTANIYRSPSLNVYQQIISDLRNAEALLNAAYVDESDTTVTTDRVRPTKWAAAALLARVYVNQGNWAGADSAASAVIENASLFSIDSLQDVFLANSSETIWQLMIPQPSSTNSTPDGSGFVLTAAPATGNFNSTTISPFLLSSFEPGDERKSFWIGSYFDGLDSFYFPFKYKNNGPNNTAATEFETVLRLGEQYLVRAEAEVHLDQLNQAAIDLNVIRNRAGLSKIANSIASSQTKLLTAVQHERQVELFTEWGQRWFDLIRTGTINSVMSSVTPLKSNGSVSWTPTDSLYPIPQSNIMVDGNLTQNNGY